MVPKTIAGIKNSHFTVVPINNLLGQLVMVTIIFSGHQLLASWCMGIDVFAENAAEALANEDTLEFEFGPGKLFPGGPLCFVDGKEIPCYCACSPNGSMTDEILRGMISQLDKFGLTIRDLDRGIWPMMFIDGHISRMGLTFLQYVNDDETKWMAVLGCCYGTGKWQFHDHPLMNGTFKSALYKSKVARVLKKRVNNMTGDIEREEIGILVGEAAEPTRQMPRRLSQ